MWDTYIYERERSERAVFLAAYLLQKVKRISFDDLRSQYFRQNVNLKLFGENYKKLSETEYFKVEVSYNTIAGIPV